jgi:N-acetyl-anhydromuramyl-L-alanine amidase AmpD
MNIIFKGSPNKDSNRKPIDRVVIHWFGQGTLASANTRFQNAENKVSAHYGISGDTVYQWVKEEDVAYHCGNYAMNQRSIGIEHDATLDHNASNETYRTSAELIANICNHHNIPLDRDHIIGHKEVISTQCPGTLDIDRIIREAKAVGGSSPFEVELLKKKVADLQETEKRLVAEKDTAVREKDQLINHLSQQITERTDKITELTLKISSLESQLLETSTQRDLAQEQAKKVKNLTEQIKELERQKEIWFGIEEKHLRTIERFKNTSYLSADRTTLFVQLLKSFLP